MIQIVVEMVTKVEANDAPEPPTRTTTRDSDKVKKSGQTSSRWIMHRIMKCTCLTAMSDPFMRSLTA